MDPLKPHRMRDAWRIALLLVLLVAVSVSASSSESAPVLALVNGESITLDDLYVELENFHRMVEDPHATVNRPQLGSLLERIINVRLLIQEARNIGLDEQEEYLTVMEGYRTGALRRLLLDQVVGDVEPDPDVFAGIHELLVKKFRILGALIESEEEAKKILQKVEAGEDFKVLIDDLTDRGLAKPTDPEQLYGPDELFPEVVAELEKLEPGGYTPLVPVRHIFAVVQLIEVKMVDTPDALAIAEDEARRVAVEEKKQKFIATLSDRHASVDREVMSSLDLDSESAGFAALKGDTRTLVTIDGAAPITVGDLCVAIEQQFFHGAERAADSGKLAQRKERVLNELVGARVTLREAEIRKIGESDQFQRLVDNYANGLLFTLFVKRVIEPDIEVVDEDFEDYMKRHAEEFTTPEMIQLDTLVFEAEQTARRTLDRLNRGADFAWTRTNATGQVNPERTDVVRFKPGIPLVTAELLPEIRDALSGASSGDFRYMTLSADGPYYVVWVRKVIPAATQPLETAKGRIARPVFEEKLQRAIDEWTRQLREASEVEVIVDGPRLAELVDFGGTE